LVSLGLGSVIVSAFEVAPWLIEISRHKTTVFVSVGVLLAANYWLAVVRPRQMNCAPGEICYIDSPFMQFNRRLYWMSLALFAVALVVTYGSVVVVKWMQ